MLIEATGIQDYVFHSNQLKQNIGASELVQQATYNWVSQTLPGPNNFEDLQVTDASISGNGLTAEVLYAVSGKAAVLFADEEKADEFARRYTRRVLKEAPGLNVAVKRRPFSPEESLPECYQQAWLELQERKRDRVFSTPLAGLGVTATCVFTGAPAVDFKDEHLVSAEVRAKLNAEPSAKERLKELIQKVGEAGYELVRDFNDLGSKGESSFIAVIHADGNNMGRRIQELGKRHAASNDNRAYILAIRHFSESVRTTAVKALEKTVDVLMDPDNLVEGKIGGIVPISEREGRKILPFRPIVFGGDDVTFVSEGRLGLALAATYLAELESLELDDGRPAFARAGVAVVKSHYPFSRAYDLSEDLCRSAKGLIREWADKGESDMSALDWHFAVTGLVLPLKEVREREYTCHSGSLLMRPVALRNLPGDWRSYETYIRVAKVFRDDEEWSGRRNKIKALRDVLRGGPEAVRLFLRGIRKEGLPDIPQRRDMKDQGWHGNQCGYYDVVEGLDFYVPLLKGGQPI
jgi:hypothetical protein